MLRLVRDNGVELDESLDNEFDDVEEMPEQDQFRG